MMRVPVRVAVCDDAMMRRVHEYRVYYMYMYSHTRYYRYRAPSALHIYGTHQMQTYIDRLIDKCHRHERNGRNSYM